jgi:molybdate/tungstate transport system substrate-binding protein
LLRRALTGAVAVVALATTACGREARREQVLTVYNAGSLARPLRAALDTFAARNDVRIDQENAGSLETARKLTELEKIPDVIALADFEVFPQLLMPEHVSWYAQFARNRMVLAYTARSRFADEMSADSWWRILLRPGVETGRADPNLDPNGYRTLLVLQLAERHYSQPGLAERLLAALPQRNVRPKEADLVGLLQAGELDYIWSYESMARAVGLEYVELPAAIDLGSPSQFASYALASVSVTGKSPTDTVVFRGAPIVYGISIPRAAPHRDVAERFLAFLLSADGRRVLRAARLDALESPVIVGTGVPASVTAAAGAR